MQLDGIDHITSITADGQRCLDFYAGILGLAFLGREQDFEAPGSHLIRLGSEPERPDGVLAFIEAPGVARGRAGNGMVHRLSWSVGSDAALDYWAGRLAAAGIESERLERAGGRGLGFADPEGLGHELLVDPAARDAGSEPAPSAIPPRHAIVRLAGVRAYGRQRVPSADILAGRLAFRVTGPDSFAVGSGPRASEFAFEAPPPGRGRLGAGTIHHVAWATAGSLPAWRQRVIGMGCVATSVIDRGSRRSIYFREPSGVLFEVAAPGSRDRQPAEWPPAPPLRRISPKVDPRVHAGALG
jgi:glyoxalase family protein